LDISYPTMEYSIFPSFSAITPPLYFAGYFPSTTDYGGPLSKCQNLLFTVPTLMRFWAVPSVLSCI